MPVKADIRTGRRRATREEQEIFLRFHRQVDSVIPRRYDDVVKEAYADLKISLIQQVRIGRTFNLAVLVTIVETMIPGYAIPQEVTDFLAKQQEAVGQ